LKGFLKFLEKQMSQAQILKAVPGDAILLTGISIQSKKQGLPG